MPDAQCAAHAHGCRKEEAMNMQNLTILYERLSHDDELQGPSNSIVNQHAMLEDYAERNSLKPYIHIQDDGYTGTNWNRPGWQRILEEIEAGRVKNLLVKNFDRIGRDYLRVGLYMEMFLEQGVRFIAINDGIDTARGEDDFTPFRAILAEWYARDASRKIKAVITSKGKSGKPIANIAPYGYTKDPEDKNHWIVDPGAAAVVKRIFEMCIGGMGPRVIATRLHEEKVERPSYYLARRGLGRYKSTCDAEHPYAWNYSTVTQILSRLEYAGHTVNFKGEKPSFKSKKYVARPQEDWLVFKNTHEAIVAQEMWELVQKLRGTKRRHDTLGAANPLTGLLYCADCGEKLFNHRRAGSASRHCGDKTYYGKPQNFYICSTHRRTSSQYDARCTPHIITTDLVRQIILELLRETNGYVREHEGEFIALVREKSALKQGESVKSYQQQIAKNGRRVAELEKIFRSLYEDKALGRLDADKFEEMSAGYEREKEDLKAQTAALQAELDAFTTDSLRADKFVELVHRYTDFNELTPTMINEFVEKIVVHEGEWSEGRNPATGRGLGTRKQKVEVYLQYIGAFDVPDSRTPEEIEAERVRQERIERERQYKREYARRRNARKGVKPAAA